MIEDGKKKKCKVYAFMKNFYRSGEFGVDFCAKLTNRWSKIPAPDNKAAEAADTCGPDRDELSNQI